MIPYGKQTLGDDDVQSVLNVLKKNTYLTTGPKVNEFEEKVSVYVGVNYGVAVNSGTAALHCAMFAAGISVNDEVIVPSISFVASANCVLYMGGKPVFCDVCSETLNIDVTKIESLINEKTKAIVCVDMCGMPCDYDKILELCRKHKLILIEDAAHSMGGKYKGQKVGSIADISCFSFHPVKNITTCEGGMMVTNNETYYKRGKSFRSHGISRDFMTREKDNSHYYEMNDLGFNYRIPDVLCALGISQMDKLNDFIYKRNFIADFYHEYFRNNEFFRCLGSGGLEKKDYYHAYHIFVIVLDLHKLNKVSKTRDTIFKELKEKGIGVNVHYMPIYLHPYYKSIGYEKGLCPVSENLYEGLITLPMFPLLSLLDLQYVCENVVKIIQ